MVAYTRSPASSAKFRLSLATAWSMLVERGLATDPEGHEQVSCVFNLAECVSDADYVQESVVEDLHLKQQIIQDIDEFAPPNVIIGSSTSFIPLSLLRARAKKHPERVATAHPSLPHWDAFCEVLGSTSKHTEWLATLYGKGGTPGQGRNDSEGLTGLGMDVVAMKKEAHGHAFNAYTMAMFAVSGRLVHSGVCTAEECDSAALHLARIVIAGGGLSGAFTGIIGGGNSEAAIDLSTDICMGYLVGVGAVRINRWIPSPLAGIALKIWQTLCRPLSWLKGFVRIACIKYNADFLQVWQKSTPDYKSFLAAALNRMVAIEKSS